MKLYNILLLFIVLFSSCKKYEEANLEFDVEVESQTYEVGDSVIFNVKGNPFQIAFYSGEVGSSYDYAATKRIDALDELFLTFSTHNTPAAGVVNPKVMMSTDFNGIYDYENLQKATWKDMSALFTWGSPAAWQTGWTSSTTQNIFSFTESGKPFYIAYKFESTAYPTGTVPSKNWRTNGHILSGTTKFGETLSLANFAGMAWKQIKKWPDAVTGSTVTSSIMLFAGPTSASPYYREAYEEWGISRKFLVDDIDMGVDRSKAIKQYIDAPIQRYAHAYAQPGDYKIVFVASSNNVSEEKKIIKELHVKILPKSTNEIL